MEEFTIEGFRYRIVGKLDALRQFHVVRRLAPLLSAFVNVDLAALREAAAAAADPAAAAAADADPRAGEAMRLLLPALADALAHMTDDDTNYVVGACIGLVERDVGGGAGWGPVWNPAAKQMQYQDISFLAMLQLLGRVLMRNVGDFGSALSQAGGTTAPGTVHLSPKASRS